MSYSQTDLIKLIDDHLSRYPAMEIRDVYKLLYQSILGSAHFITSAEDFTARLQTELDEVTADESDPLLESIHPGEKIKRLNLRPFKAREGDVGVLTTVCIQTANRKWGTPEFLRETWAKFVGLCQEGQWARFSLPDALAFSEWLKEVDYLAVHHSARYEEEYRPAYRLVGSDFLLELGVE